MAVLWWCHISRAWGGSGWGCDATPPRCTHRVRVWRVRSCEERRDDTPLQIWFYLWNSLCLNLCFLTSAGRIRTPAAGKQHDVISRCFCSLGNLIECRLQSTPIEEVQFSLYNSLTEILPNIKWGNVAPLTSITGFFPTIRSAELIIATVSISGSSSFLLIGNRFVPGAKRSRGWHLFSNHSLRRLCPSQWGKKKSHPWSRCIKSLERILRQCRAERSAHTSAEAGAGIGCVGDGGKPGRSHDIPQTCTGYLVWCDPKMKECASNIHWKHRMCESTKNIGEKWKVFTQKGHYALNDALSSAVLIPHWLWLYSWNSAECYAADIVSSLIWSLLSCVDTCANPLDMDPGKAI